MATKIFCAIFYFAYFRNARLFSSVFSLLACLCVVLFIRSGAMWDVNCELFCISLIFGGISLKCACLIFCFTVGCSQLKRLKWYKERVSEIILYIVIITDVSFWQAYFLFHCGEQRAEERNKECFSFAFSELWVCVCVGMMVVVWPHWFHEC